MAIKSVHTDPTDVTREHHEYHMTDNRGRTVGVRVVRQTDVFTPAPADATYGHHIEPGTYYAATVQPTRDGTPFGATQPLRHFSNKADRETYVKGAVESTRKRYAKQFG